MWNLMDVHNEHTKLSLVARARNRTASLIAVDVVLPDGNLLRLCDSRECPVVVGALLVNDRLRKHTKDRKANVCAA